MTRAAVAALVLLALAACGRKSAPLPPEAVHPLPPTNFHAESAKDGVHLVWTRPSQYSGGRRMRDLRGFEIERAPGEGGPPEFQVIYTLELTDQTRFRPEPRIEWTDTNVVAGTRYLYRVTALTLDGYRSAPAGPIAIRWHAGGGGAKPAAPGAQPTAEPPATEEPPDEAEPPAEEPEVETEPAPSAGAPAIEAPSPDDTDDTDDLQGDVDFFGD